MATCSSILAWEIRWTEKPGELWSMECKKSDMSDLTEHTHTHIHTPLHQPLKRKDGYSGLK